MKKQEKKPAGYWEKRINFFYGTVPKSMLISLFIYIGYLGYLGYKQDQQDTINEQTAIIFKNEYLNDSSLIEEKIQLLGRRPSNQKKQSILTIK